MTSNDDGLELMFDIASAKRWAALLAEPKPTEPFDPDATLDEALRQGLHERGRYTHVLRALALPTLWGTSHDELDEQLREAMTRLHAPVPDSFYVLARVPDDVVAACEDYNMEEWREQTARVAERANELLPPEFPAVLSIRRGPAGVGRRGGGHLVTDGRATSSVAEPRHRAGSARHRDAALTLRRRLAAAGREWLSAALPPRPRAHQRG